MDGFWSALGAATLWFTIGAVVIPTLLIATGTILGVRKFNRHRQAEYLAAKSTLSPQLIALDEQLGFAEALDDPAMQRRAAKARVHLNRAFDTYRANFGYAEYTPGVNTRAASAAIAADLQVVTNQLRPVPAGSTESLLEAGKELGRELASFAKASTTKLLTSGTSELNRIVAQQRAGAPAEPIGVPRSRLGN